MRLRLHFMLRASVPPSLRPVPPGIPGPSPPSHRRSAPHRGLPAPVPSDPWGPTATPAGRGRGGVPRSPRHVGLCAKGPPGPLESPPRAECGPAGGARCPVPRSARPPPVPRPLSPRHSLPPAAPGPAPPGNALLPPPRSTAPLRSALRIASHRGGRRGRAAGAEPGPGAGPIAFICKRLRQLSRAGRGAANRRRGGDGVALHKAIFCVGANGAFACAE